MSPWYTVSASRRPQIAATVPRARAPSVARAARPSRGDMVRRWASATITATTNAAPRATVAASQEIPVSENGDSGATAYTSTTKFHRVGWGANEPHEAISGVGTDSSSPAHNTAVVRRTATTTTPATSRTSGSG